MLTLTHKQKYTNYFTGLQLCFGQPVDIEILTLLRSKVDEVAEAVQTWMLKKKQVLNFFSIVSCMYNFFSLFNECSAKILLIFKIRICVLNARYGNSARHSVPTFGSKV